MREEEERLQARVRWPGPPPRAPRAHRPSRLWQAGRAASLCAGAPQARALSRQQRAWLHVELAPGLGADCDRYKWTQSQSRVEVFFPLPEHVLPRQARMLWRASQPCHAARPCAAFTSGAVSGRQAVARDRWSWS
jgi:hypothetical protein